MRPDDDSNRHEIPRRAFLSGASVTAAATVLGQVFPFRQALAEEIQETAARVAPGFRDLRAAYGLSDNVTYLNHASIGTVPTVVGEARREYLKVCETNPWLHVWGGAWKEGVDEARARGAAYLGCEAAELAFTHNTTEAFNLLAHGLPLEPGDEVLFSSLNHSGASVCWHHMARTRGFRVKGFDFPVLDTPGLKPDDVVNLYLDEITDRTRVLVFPHIDNVVGIRHPVARLAAGARRRGVEFIAVDGAQAVGMIDVEVPTLGVDFYATSAHKWLQAPKETGLFYVRRSTHEKLRPMWVTWGQKSWSQDARAFEDYGTRDLSTILAVGHAIDFQTKLGAKKKEQHYRGLRDHCRRRVEADSRLEWRSPGSWDLAGSLHAIEIKGRPSEIVFASLLAGHGFVARPFSTLGLNTLRISPNAMNTRKELDRFFDALRA